MMQKLTSEEYELLQDSVVKRLAQNRITTVLEFLQEDIEKLLALTKLTFAQVLAIRSDIFKKHSPPLISGATTLIHNVKRKHFLSTGIENLDRALKSGLPVGYITELCGLADSGKTQLCLQLAINCAQTTDNTVLYVDTTGDFSAVRVQKILDACGCSHKEMALIMLKIKVVHIWTMEDIIELFRKLKNRTLIIDELTLIIIDSLPSLMFQFLADENKIGLSLLNNFVNLSRFLCKELNIVVICVNINTRWIDQDTSEYEDVNLSSTKDSYVEKRNRCLGKYWQNIPALVLFLEKCQDKDSTEYTHVNVTVKSCYEKCNFSCILKINNFGVA